MVHAYLMYGFPTQTAQETIDAMETVRQLFEQNILQSGFWHRFAMTAHSPVGMHPELFNVSKVTDTEGTFANNDIEHLDPAGARHELFGEGLRKSLFNYMHGICFDFPLQEWFDFRIPKTTIPADYISKALASQKEPEPKNSSRIVWLGSIPVQEQIIYNRKGKSITETLLVFSAQKSDIEVTGRP